MDTAVLGEAYRNVTSWQDPDVSRAAFAIGNALFAAVFFGRSTILLLWMAFVAAFVVPKRHQLLEWAADVQVTDLLVSTREALAGTLALLRERLAAMRAPAFGGGREL